MQVTQTSRSAQNCALYVPCSQVVQLARVSVRELVVVVVCVMLVLIARVVCSSCKYTVLVAIFCSWRCTLYRTCIDDYPARSMCRAHSCNLRVSWFACVCLLMYFCVMIVLLIAHVDVVQFS